MMKCHASGSLVLAHAYVVLQILVVRSKFKQYFAHRLHSVSVAAAAICVQAEYLGSINKTKIMFGCYLTNGIIALYST
jgi:hypothetical protein